MTTQYSVIRKHDANPDAQWHQVLSTWDTEKAADDAMQMWHQLSPHFADVISVRPSVANEGTPTIYFGAVVSFPQTGGSRVDHLFDVQDTIPRNSEKRNAKGYIVSVTVWAASLEAREVRVREALESLRDA